MKKDDILDAMGRIDTDLIEETAALRTKRKRNRTIWITAAAMAACAALIFAVSRPAAPALPAETSGQISMESASAPPAEEAAPEQAPPAPIHWDTSARIQLLDFSSADASAQVTPSVPSYTVGDNLSNVTNLNQFYLSEEQMALLEEHMFFVSNGYCHEFYEIYEYNRYDLIPNFVTVDSLMHTYHLYFSLLLNRTEKNYLADQLLELSKAMLQTSTMQAEQLAGTVWETAAQRNAAYFAIAAVLQDPDTAVPDFAADLVQWELDRIYAADGITQSRLAQDFMDYSQYKPRGYYEGDEVLERYFRAMMWYGQVNFAQSEEDLNRSALLMTLAMAQTDFAAWEQIYTVTSFFAGVSDDLGYYEYAPTVEEAYGGFPTTDQLITEKAAFDRWCDLINDLPAPAINSVPVYMLEEGDLGEMNKGFRFMGQRFTVDAAVMQQLVYRAVDGANAEGNYRKLPDVLDFPAALGSEQALKLLEAQGETEYGGYMENMTQMQSVLSAAPEASWTTSLYSSWLYTLTPLLQTKGEGYPSFMTTEAWQTKSLESFAGSFTELKHDTVLYAKQVMAEMGGGPPEEVDDRGYVEPEPEVFRRFMLLAEQTAAGLDGYGILSSADLENLSRLEELARRLMVIANKELENQLLTDEEYDLIREYGGTLEHFWIEAVKDRTDAPYLDPQEIPASLVTDIATDPDGRVLQIANGSPAKILVIVPIDGQLRIASGVVYNFYQFEQPLAERLTDTEWRLMIGEWAGEDGWYHRENTPDKPWWTQSYWLAYEW